MSNDTTLPNLSENEKKYLLSLSRRTLMHFSQTHTPLRVTADQIVSENLRKKYGSFVTLQIGANLRGCIGNILPTQELYKDIIDNSISAGFYDPRFPPIQHNELAHIRIELSVLSNPKKIACKNPSDLCAKLTPKRDGVILKNGVRSSTFLPQVWDHFNNDIEAFLSALSIKAGLPKTAWKDAKTEVSIYSVEAWNENDLAAIDDY